MEPITSARSFIWLRKLFDVYMQVLLIEKQKRKSLFLHVHVRFRWIQLFFYLAQVEADGGDQEEVDKVKKQQKAPCFGC